MGGRLFTFQAGQGRIHYYPYGILNTLVSANQNQRVRSLRKPGDRVTIIAGLEVP